MTFKDEIKYQFYQGIFKKLRQNAKTTYYSKLLHAYKTDSKWAWEVLKEITRK